VRADERGNHLLVVRVNDNGGIWAGGWHYAKSSSVGAMGVRCRATYDRLLSVRDEREERADFVRGILPAMGLEQWVGGAEAHLRRIVKA